MNSKNIDLIKQALVSAESSIKLAKQLLTDLETGKIETAVPQNKEQNKNLPGLTGSFDGENMVTTTGETFPVPANYASKSMLVVGDTLKLVEEGKEKRFKQIEHVKRFRTNGILTKKDGKWKAITPEGTYKVLPVTVEHLGGDVGSEVVLHLPANNLTVSYAAIESLKGEKKASIESNSSEVEKDKTNEQKKATEKPLLVDQKPVPESTKPEVKAESEVKKIEVQKKEIVIDDKSSKEIKLDEKPKVTPQPKPIEVSPKQEVTKKPEPQKVEPVVATVPILDKPAEVIPSIVAPKPMEISPEEDELA